MRLAAALLVTLATGVVDAAPAPLSTPAFSPGERTFVTYEGKPARIRVAWSPVSGATRYRAAWLDNGTRIDVEIPGSSTVFERSEPRGGHHELSIVALDDTGRESSPAAIALDVVTVHAIAPGSDEPSAPTGRAFAIGTRFSSPGLACQLGGDTPAEEVIALRVGGTTLVCGGGAGQPKIDIPIVIAPVIVASHASPIRVERPTIIHVAIASAAEIGDDLGVTIDEGMEVDAIARTDAGLDVTITAHVVKHATVRVAVGGIELGKFDVESIAAPPPASPPITRADWLGLEVGGHVGVFTPPTFGTGSTNIGHPVVAGDAVSWGPMVGGRVGLFPIRRVGLEVEVGLSPTGYEARAGISTVLLSRAQIAVRVVEDDRYGLRLIAGADMVGQLVDRGTSQRSLTGGVHAGAAFSIEVGSHTWLRLEALDIVLPARDFDYAHCIELQFGISTRIGRVDRF